MLAGPEARGYALAQAGRDGDVLLYRTPGRRTEAQRHRGTDSISPCPRRLVRWGRVGRGGNGAVSGGTKRRRGARAQRRRRHRDAEGRAAGPKRGQAQCWRRGSKRKAAMAAVDAGMAAAAAASRKPGIANRTRTHGGGWHLPSSSPPSLMAASSPPSSSLPTVSLLCPGRARPRPHPLLLDHHHQNRLARAGCSAAARAEPGAGPGAYERKRGSRRPCVTPPERSAQYKVAQRWSRR